MQNIKDIINLIRRRILIFLLSSIPIFIIVTVVAFILPPIYVSKSTILIESQQIPQEYVRTTVTGYVEQRLQGITQQILSRANLISIINQFNLYAEMRTKYATEIVLDKMRKNIKLETIEAGGRRGGRDSTIAFTLSYEGGNPTIVQKVSTVLASLYLEENLKKREAQATRTTQFLQQELNHIKEQINEYGIKISEFKNAHAGELPEYAVINAQAMEQLKRDLDQADMQISSLEERKVYLQGQLASIKASGFTGPAAAAGGSGVFASGPGERLRSLKLELISLQSRLSKKHPDVIKIKREIKELEDQIGGPIPSGGEEERLNDLKNQLAAMRTRLGPEHPDVVKLSKEVASLSQEIEKGKTGPSSNPYTESDNPAYINIKTQIDTIDLEIRQLTEEKKKIKTKMEYYQKKMENAPLVEKEYESLTTDYNNARQKYNEIMSKLMEAKVARGMEETQHGERFTIIEPANIPEAPEKPNRKKILLMGLFLALGVGGGLAFLQENLDHSIKTPHELDELAHLPVLASIPLMVTEEEIIIKRKRILVFSLATIGGMFAVIAVVHFFFMPLDILLLKIQQKLMITM